MKYKGIELKEITEPQIFDPPKKMLVWRTNKWNSEQKTLKTSVALRFAKIFSGRRLN